VARFLSIIRQPREQNDVFVDLASDVFIRLDTSLPQTSASSLTTYWQSVYGQEGRLPYTEGLEARNNVRPIKNRPEATSKGVGAPVQ